MKNGDPVNHPAHYTAHPSGVECITIAEHFNFNVGNAIKYLWRAGLKGDIRQDLEKALFYITREIERIEREAKAEADDKIIVAEAYGVDSAWLAQERIRVAACPHRYTRYTVLGGDHTGAEACKGCSGIWDPVHSVFFVDDSLGGARNGR